MARPTKKNTDKLSKTLPPVRCNEQDYMRVKDRADKASQSMSEYIRYAAINGKIVVKQSNADFSLIQELKRSGNNLNQLTKLYHSTGNEPFELGEVLTAHNLILKKVFDSP